MKVCILNMKGNFDKTLGTGTQRTSYELWRNIKPLSIKEGINVDRVEIGSGGSLNARKISFTMMLPFYDFSKYDIVHLLIPIPMAPRVHGKTKILTTVNEFVILKEGSIAHQKIVGKPLKGSIKTYFSSLIGKGISKQIFDSDYISVNSTQTRHEAISLGYPGDRIFIVNHGVDERFLSPIKRKEESGIFRVGYIGALNVRKNLSFAIDAFRRIGSDKIEFEIWGKPVLEYRNLVDQAKENKMIKFMGFAPEDRIVGIYDRFDVFVFPSLYEGFGLPIMEAQARGLPVIIFKEGRIPKEVRKYCFEAKDEEDMARIILNLSKNGYNKKIRERAIKYARGFTRRNEALQTLKVYKKIYALQAKPSYH